MKANHENLTLTITALGGLGDGIAEHEGNAVYVPYTCVGDVVTARVLRRDGDALRAALVEVVTPSPNRQDPACMHFSECGGCALQHIDEGSYRQFKEQYFRKMLQGLGLDAEQVATIAAPMRSVGWGARRRIKLTVAVQKGQVTLGFLAPKSHRLMEVQQCPVSADSLIDALPALNQCLSVLKKPGLIKAISLTALDKGIDASLTVSAPLVEVDRAALKAYAMAQGWVRLGEEMEGNAASTRVIYDSGNAVIRFGDAEVALPIGAFLQATQAGQDAITEWVTTHLAGHERIADIYSGCGTYSFPLVQIAQRVAAYEGDPSMVAALYNAIIRQGMEGRMTATARDLVAEPLNVKELQPFDAVVINPPRNGALPQMQQIAASHLRKVVAVSCNPATFQRDAKALLSAGFHITHAVPIDQFYATAHLELVAVFERD